MLFGCPRQNINHSSENLKVIYIKCSMFYAIINYQFKTSELKNVEKLVKQTVQALKSYQNRLGMCIFVQSVKLYSQQVVLENVMWFLKSPCKMVAIFCMNPVNPVDWERPLLLFSYCIFMYLVFVIYCTPPGNCCRCLNDENQIQSSMPQITITYPKNNLNQLFNIKTRKFRIKESNIASVKRMVLCSL